MPIDFMISGVDSAAIEWITGRIVAAIQRGDAGDADALRFLLRRYCATDRADLRDALEPGLAEGLRCQAAAGTIDERAAWLTLFAEAAAVSDDDRLRVAGVDLSAALRQEWGRVAEVGAGAAGVEACLLAGSYLVEAQSIVPGAIDELERIVGAAYRPGAGLARSVDEPGGARGRLADHVRTASALLTAFAVSDRLPYPMLAEELMQFARESLWNEAAGLFSDPADAPRSFAINCAAAGVLCRLAALHGRSDYRAAAVIRPDADYAGDAARILRSQAGTFREQDATGAAYGLALMALGEFRSPNC
jgi:hypothetical protein